MCGQLFFSLQEKQNNVRTFSAVERHVCVPLAVSPADQDPVSGGRGQEQPLVAGVGCGSFQYGRHVQPYRGNLLGGAPVFRGIPTVCFLKL